MFSDGLDIKTCVELKAAADEAGIGSSFGVGTFLTNGRYRGLCLWLFSHLRILTHSPPLADFQRVSEPIQQTPAELGRGEPLTAGDKSPALNMVIKLFKINDQFCVKISDDLSKNTGDPASVKLVKGEFRLEDGGA